MGRGRRAASARIHSREPHQPVATPLVTPYRLAVASDDPSQRLMAHALAVVQAAVPVALVGFASVDRHGVPGDVVQLTPRYPDGELQRQHPKYTRRFRFTDPFAAHRFVDTEHRVVTAADVGGQDAFLRTAYGRLQVLPQGLRWQTSMFLRHRGRLVASLVLFRGREEGDFSPAEITFLRRYQPLLQLAYSTALDAAPTSAKDELLERLTERELEVALLAGAGATNSEIARELILAEATVKSHLVHVFAKLSVKSRTELALKLTASQVAEPDRADPDTSIVS